MTLKSLFLVALVAALPGCKIVYDEDRAGEIPDGPEGDDIRNAARLEETFEAQLLPRINDTAVSVVALTERLAQEDVAAVGAEIGNQGSGQGAAWNFSIMDTGTIVAAKTDTSARTADLDVDADGTADVRVQLGPVIRGTALRDVAPFYVFDDFRDQIEFAKLSRAINNKIKPALVVPEGDLVGTKLSFTGVAPLKRAGDDLVVTPIQLEFSQ